MYSRLLKVEYVNSLEPENQMKAVKLNSRWAAGGFGDFKEQTATCLDRSRSRRINTPLIQWLKGYFTKYLTNMCLQNACGLAQNKLIKYFFKSDTCGYIRQVSLLQKRPLFEVLWDQTEEKDTTLEPIDCFSANAEDGNCLQHIRSYFIYV